MEYWAKEKWWLAEEYSRVRAYHGITQEEIEDRLNRVIGVFTPEWQQATAPHPAFQGLLPKGTIPLQFLFTLGGNLRTVAGSLRVKHLIDDLRLPDTYESARLELSIAAHLKAKGHEIEFRPPLRSRKRADVAATHGEQEVFLEVKCMQSSKRQEAMDELGRQIGFLASDIEFGYPHLAGKWFRVEISPSVADLLIGQPAADTSTIRTIVKDIERELVRNAETHETFEIPRLASVAVVTDRMQSGVNWPMASCEDELKRFLRAHLHKAITQLPLDYPGVIVAQTSGVLDEDLTMRIIDGWVRESNAVHVSAVLFLPTYNVFPSTWALFRPFAVINREAKFPATDLRAFRDMEDLLTNEVAVPTAE